MKKLSDKEKIEKLSGVLLKIVGSVHPYRNRGEHIYPTEFRDEAVGVLNKCGFEIKTYSEYQLETEKRISREQPV